MHRREAVGQTLPGIAEGEGRDDAEPQKRAPKDQTAKTVFHACHVVFPRSASLTIMQRGGRDAMFSFRVYSLLGEA